MGRSNRQQPRAQRNAEFVQTQVRDDITSSSVNGGHEISLMIEGRKYIFNEHRSCLEFLINHGIALGNMFKQMADAKLQTQLRKGIV
eukprot:Awhi_evm1s6544